MSEPLGAVANRKRKQRLAVEIAILILMISGAIVYLIFNVDTTESKGALEIVMGPGAEMKATYVGPSELQVQWDNVTGHEWSVALIEGRLRNVSNKIVTFEDVIYRVKDDQGGIIWQQSDSRFEDGGRLGVMQYFNFAAQPMSKKDATSFEVVIAGAEVFHR